MAAWVCLNGELVPEEQARVSVFDSGFMQGIGLFETMRTYGGRVFRLDEHLARLLTSAQRLGWAVLPDSDVLIEHVDRVIAAAHSDEDLRVRLTVTTGSLHYQARPEPALTIVATATPGVSYPAELYAKGATVALSPYRQGTHDPTTGHKTTSYFARLASLREAHAKRALEALWFTSDGHLAEGAISNVFVVAAGQLLTPPLDTPVLPGITREVVLEIAKQLGIGAVEQPLTLDDVFAAEELLLTNALMEVMPVVRIERRPVGNEKPGPVFAELLGAYRELAEQECARGDAVDDDDAIDAGAGDVALFGGADAAGHEESAVDHEEDAADDEDADGDE